MKVYTTMKGKEE